MTNRQWNPVSDDPCIEILKDTMSIYRGPWTNRRNR